MRRTPDNARFGAVVTLIGALICLAAFPAVVEAKGLRNCGDAVKIGAGAYDVRASKNVKCSEAKQVARRFFPGGETRFDKWKCRSTKRLGTELTKAKCKRFNGPDREIVRFNYGA